MSPAALLLAGLLAPAAPPVLEGRYVMGTVLEIRLPPGTDRRLLEPLFARAAELETVFSGFDPRSALSRLNRNAGRGPRSVPPDLARLLSLSREYARLTGGAFDVTLGPLVTLWSHAERRGRRPGPAEIAQALRSVGPDGLRVDTGESRAELRRSGMRLELGGVAKGFTLDCLVEMLRSQGVERALLSFGQSSIHALGAPPGEPGWRVLLRDPSGGFSGVATLRDQALSFSASLGRSIEIEGRRYGHILDPRTGEPLAHRQVAAVVSTSGARAEALSKALLVLGPERAREVLESLPGTEGMRINAAGEVWLTSGWGRAARFTPVNGSLSGSGRSRDRASR